MKGSSPALPLPDSFLNVGSSNVPATIPNHRPGTRDVVLSRRSLLEADAAQKAAKTRQRLDIGPRFTGTVTGVRDFGWAFSSSSRRERPGLLVVGLERALRRRVVALLRKAHGRTREAEEARAVRCRGGPPRQATARFS